MNCLMYILSWFLLQRKGVSLDNTSMFLKAKSFHCYHYSIWDWDVSQLSNVIMASASPAVSQFAFCFLGDSSPTVDCTFNVTQRNDCLVDVWLSRLFKILKGSDWEIWQQFHFATWSNLATRAWFKSCLFEKMFGQISSAPAIPALDVI